MSDIIGTVKPSHLRYYIMNIVNFTSRQKGSSMKALRFRVPSLVPKIKEVWSMVVRHNLEAKAERMSESKFRFFSFARNFLGFLFGRIPF